jgi:hypothetical protein
VVSGSIHHGQDARLKLKLSGKGRKALAAAGKLTVSLSGTVSSAPASAPTAGSLKLVAKKSKK